MAARFASFLGGFFHWTQAPKRGVKRPLSAVQEAAAKAKAEISETMAVHTGPRSVHKKAMMFLARAKKGADDPANNPCPLTADQLLSLEMAAKAVKAQADKLQALGATASRWTKDTLATHTASLDVLKRTIGASEATLVALLSAAEKVVRDARGVAAKARKSQAMLLKKATKPWVDLGLSAAWAAELVDVGLLRVDRSSTESHLVEDSPLLPESAVEPGLVQYTPTVVTADTIAMPDWQRPLFVPAVGDVASPEVLGNIRGVLDTDLGSRVTDAVAKLSAHMLENPSAPLGICRMSNKSTEDKEFDSMLWLPEALRRATEAPESVGSFGAPWMCTMRPYACRFTPNEFPSLGFSHLAVVHSGRMAVLAWDIKLTDNHDLRLCQAHHWIMTQSRHDISGFMSRKSVVHCKLEPRDSVWIPNGWACMWVNLGTVACDAALIPVLSSARALREVTPSVLREVCQAGKDFVACNSGFPAWSQSLGPALKGWLSIMEATVGAACSGSGTGL